MNPLNCGGRAADRVIVTIVSILNLRIKIFSIYSKTQRYGKFIRSMRAVLRRP